MNQFYDRAFKYLIVDEGTVFTNDPLDSGGATKWGITQRDYERFAKRVVTVQEIKDLTEEQAKDFFLNMYWIPLRLFELNFAGPAIAILDSAVLYGEPTIVKMVQSVCNYCGQALAIDGIIGENTIAGINEVDEIKFVSGMHDFLLARIDSICAEYPKNERFRAGWTKRADRLLTLVSVGPETNS